MERRGAEHTERDVAELARSVDCFTETEFVLLAGIKSSTAEAWRKRGRGPAYVLIGNRVLYPRSSVAEHLKTLMRERVAGGAKGLL